MKFLLLTFILLSTYNLSSAQDLTSSKEESSPVEVMPRFPGCEDSDITDEERKECSKYKMLEYVYNNLEYPESAVKNGLEGTCIVQFIVTAEGRIKNPQVVRNFGAGFGKSVLNLMSKMDQEKTWIPGLSNGKPVEVKYTLPIKFSLDMYELKKKKSK